jgi:hypothetical protein
MQQAPKPKVSNYAFIDSQNPYDAPYLPLEKCAQRCAKLSALLTATVAVDNAATPTLH